MIEVNNKVYIRHRPFSSAFFNINKKTIKQSESMKYIGSAITKGGYPLKGLDPDEEALYLAELLNVLPTSQEFGLMSRTYWNNMRKLVPDGDTGLELEIGFKYETEEKKALGESIDGIDEKAFKQRQKHGRPISVEDYVLYRYCLVYRRVANSIDDVNISNDILFYIYTYKADVDNKYKKYTAKKDANTFLVKNVLPNRDLVKNILIVYERFDVESEQEQDMLLDELVTQDPAKFLTVAQDPDLNLRSMIQKAVRQGYLQKMANTEAIMNGTTDVLGHTMDEAVAALKTERRSELRTALNVKLKSGQNLEVTSDFKDLASGLNTKKEEEKIIDQKKIVDEKK